MGQAENTRLRNLGLMGTVSILEGLLYISELLYLLSSTDSVL